MEAAPPSYEKATLTDPWNIIAAYIPLHDLCSAALVCRQWHSVFTPHLWGNPASHFEIENEYVYEAMTRFLETLDTARLLVRSFTHTLHLPPAHAEWYNRPQYEWLRNVLDRLPNLQSLIVRGLPFFDHSTLQALKQPTDFFPAFGLRLLDASHCVNLTASSLAQALSQLEDLLYLDLSFTQPARDFVVLATLRRVSGLKVLKLRGIGLTDADLVILAPAIDLRVRSLDVRNNNIGDEGVLTLVNSCFLDSDASGDYQEDRQRSNALLSSMGHEALDIYRGNNFESSLKKSLTQGFVSRLAIEDVSPSGVTHLYIGGNHLSVEGQSALFKSDGLHVLDTQPEINKLPRPAWKSSHSRRLGQSLVARLIAIISKHPSDTMEYLRIDHSVVTEDVPKVIGEDAIPGKIDPADTAGPDPPDYDTASEYSSTSIQRRARIKVHLASSNNLHPAMLPHLTALVLTDIPSRSSTKDVSDGIIRFIQQCAEEATFARNHAKSDYTLPPRQRGQSTAIKHAAEKMFALKVLVLEIVSVNTPARSAEASQWHHQGTKSMTDDRDSETLWSAAETDFSFFKGEDDNLPSLNSVNYKRSEQSNHRRVQPNDSRALQDTVIRAENAQQPQFDTVALVSAFRRKRKLAHQQNIAAGAIDAETAGYWDGVVQVKRPGNGDADESKYYGS